jgi:hypothetical protein
MVAERPGAGSVRGGRGLKDHAPSRLGCPRDQRSTYAAHPLSHPHPIFPNIEDAAFAILAAALVLAFWAIYILGFLVAGPGLAAYAGLACGIWLSLRTAESGGRRSRRRVRPSRRRPPSHPVAYFQWPLTGPEIMSAGRRHLNGTNARELGHSAVERCSRNRFLMSQGQAVGTNSGGSRARRDQCRPPTPAPGAVRTRRAAVPRRDGNMTRRGTIKGRTWRWPRRPANR